MPAADAAPPPRTAGAASALGAALASRRAELGLSRRELAQRAGLSYPFVSELERGAKTPSATSLLALARALELSPAQLLARAEAPAPVPGADRPVQSPRALADLTTLVRELVRDELAAGGAVPGSIAKPDDVSGLTVPELRERALRTLRAVVGDELAVDEEGDIPVRSGEVMVFVRALDDPLSVLVFAPVLVDVDATAALDDRLNEINAGVRFVRFCWVRRSVVADLELFADPFVPEHLEPALHAVGRAAEEFLGDLRATFGGEPFIPDESQGSPPVAPRGTLGYL